MVHINRAIWTAIASIVTVSVCAKAHAQSCNVSYPGSCIGTGNSGSGDGIFSSSNTGFGVEAFSTSGEAIYASSDGTVSIEGYSPAHTAIFGHADGGGTGIYGTSFSGVGGFLYSQSGNAVEGVNTRTDWSAAVITSLAGSANGLSYYGNGGIQIHGDAQKPGGGMWNGLSDRRLKKDVKDFRLGLQDLMHVQPVTYQYNGLGGTEDDGQVRVGVIAQELEKVFPAMVSTRKAKLHPTDAEVTDIKQVDPSEFTYILINAVQEQQRVIERQGARIATLEAGRGTRVAGVAESGIGIGLAGIAGVFVVIRRRKHPEARAKLA